MTRTRNRQQRFQATVRNATITAPVHYYTVTVSTWWYPYTEEQQRLVQLPHEWAWFAGASSLAYHRPHLKRETQKNPRTVKRHDDTEHERKFDARGKENLARTVDREWRAEQHQDNTTWVREPRYESFDLGWGENVLVMRGHTWVQKEEPAPHAVPRAEKSVLFKSSETPGYTTRTPAKPAPAAPTTTVEHYHPSPGRPLINATNRSHIHPMQRPTRARVWEVAREIGMAPSDLAHYLRRTGEYVSSASSVIEAPVVRRVLADLRPEEAHA